MSTSLIPQHATASALPCEISMACQNAMRKQLPDGQGYRELDCHHNLRYFACLCSKTNSLGANAYFDAHCLFGECAKEGERLAFITAYREACERSGTSLVDVPEEWRPFGGDLPLLGESASRVLSSGFAASTLASPSTNLVASIIATPSTPTRSTTMASSPTTQSLVRLSRTATLTASVRPGATYDAGFQFPVCNIGPKCMKKGPDKAKCRHQDFQCICLASNSLADNTQFDQQCVLDDCMGDIAKEEFLDYLTYQCSLGNRSLLDIPKQWQPYLPTSLLPSPISTPFPSSPISISPSSPLPPPTPIPIPIPHLSPGAKAGIALSILATLAGFTALGFTFLRARRKVRVVLKRNAELVDRQNFALGALICDVLEA
ncbi:hypothetical protein IAQ61_004689 [Plenodomus lingam]|uniref:uncharacterized protein n=1 Tax=Leptosphaeria maculans TaxID=5022 RepID=UPI00332CE66F|nr:hypothetical protein IAQ61_004689 [Plenodomus lingam]